MTVTLLVVTDGRRDCVEQTVQSASEMLKGEIERFILVNDNPQDGYRHWLDTRFSEFERIHHDKRKGFAGAIETGWAAIREQPTEFVYHLEDDFVHNRPVPLANMAKVLTEMEDLVQLALRRQPWNAQERAAGGIVEQWPDAYKERHRYGQTWLEHRLFFTTNPSLYRSQLCSLGWPQVVNSEGVFSHSLLANPLTKFGFWGAREDAPWVHHIGKERAGTGY